MPLVFRFHLPAFLLFLPAMTLAQEGVTPDMLQTKAHRALRHELERHEQARIQMKGADWVEVHDVSLEGTNLVLPAPGANPASTVALTDISKIQVRKGSSGRGALVGGLIGAAGGVVGGIALANSCGGVGFGCDPSTGDLVGGGLFGGVVGGAVGAGLGALIGPAFKRWDTVFEGSKDSSSHRLSRLDATGFAVTMHF